jgi:hypothetical protein
MAGLWAQTKVRDNIDRWAWQQHQAVVKWIQKISNEFHSISNLIRFKHDLSELEIF